MPKIRQHTYRHVTQAVYQTPWAITEEKLSAILDVIDLRRRGQRISEEELRIMFGDADSDDDSLFAVTDSGIAVMRLQGVIAQRMNMFMRISGGTSTEQFAAAFERCLADPEIKAIVLDVNSPGGGTGGVAELSDKIFAARGTKPIVAVANTLMASAAYWIASAADEVVASPSSMVGSVGVLMVHAERSRQDEKLGITRSVIRAGRYKALGNDAEPLTTETRGKLQEFVDSMYALFVEAVARNRGTTASAVTGGMGEGDLAIGRDAVTADLADHVDTLEGVVAKLSARLKSGGFENNARVTATAGADAAQNLANPTHHRKEKGVPTVNPQIKAHLVTMALIATAGVADAVAASALLGWYRLQGKTAPEGEEAIVADLVAAIDAGRREHKAAELAELQKKAALDERHRASTIRAKCKALKISAEKAEEFVELGLSAEATNEKLIDFLASDERGGPVPTRDHSAERGAFGELRFERSERDKFAAAAVEGLSARCQMTANGAWAADVQKNLSPAGREMFGFRLMDLAAESLRMQGVNTRGMAPSRIAELALASDRPEMIAAAGGTAFYETGNFAQLTLNSARKVLMRGYVEAPVTFREWCRIGEPVIDFKVNSIVKFGEHSDLENMPEGEETPMETRLSDDREYFVVETYARKSSFTRQMILNDDLSALSRLPMKQGIAAARTFNKLVYDILAKNPKMADGNALFDAVNHQGNLLTGAGAPTITSLNKIQAALRTMHGLNSDSFLNNAARWLIVPAALEATANQLLRSQTDPALTNVGVINPFYGLVKPVVEAYLDHYSTSQYYGAVDYNMVDTIEVRYLQGEETPFLESWWDLDKDVRFFKVRQTGAALPVDYRGMVFVQS